MAPGTSWRATLWRAVRTHCFQLLGGAVPRGKIRGRRADGKFWVVLIPVLGWNGILRAGKSATAPGLGEGPEHFAWKVGDVVRSRGRPEHFAWKRRDVVRSCVKPGCGGLALDLPSRLPVGSRFAQNRFTVTGIPCGWRAISGFESDTYPGPARPHFILAPALIPHLGAAVAPAQFPLLGSTWLFPRVRCGGDRHAQGQDKWRASPGVRQSRPSLSARCLHHT